MPSKNVNRSSITTIVRAGILIVVFQLARERARRFVWGESSRAQSAYARTYLYSHRRERIYARTIYTERRIYTEGEGISQRSFSRTRPLDSAPRNAQSLALTYTLARARTSQGHHSAPYKEGFRRASARAF